MKKISDVSIITDLESKLSQLHKNIKSYQEDKNCIGLEEYIKSHPSSALFSSNALYFLKSKDQIRDILGQRGLIDIYNRIFGYYEEFYDFNFTNSIILQFKSVSENNDILQSDFSLPFFILLFYEEIIFHSKYLHDAVEISKNDKLEDEIENHFLYLKRLFHFLDAFSKYHPSLYYTGKYYRDHLSHSIRVAWLVDKLFEKWQQFYLISIKNRFQKFLTDMDDFKHNSEDIESFVNAAVFNDNRHIYTSVGRRISFISGIFHDVAYPLSYLIKEEKVKEDKSVVEGLKELLVSVIPLFENNFVSNNYKLSVGGRCHWFNDFEKNLKYLNSQFDNIQNKYENQVYNNDDFKVCRKNISDHGVISALYLQNIPKEARQAIAFHNLHKDKKIDLFTDPIAFILVLCDEAQEWGRCLISSSGDTFIPVTEIKLEMSKKNFNVEIDFSDANNLKKLKEFNFDIYRMAKDKYNNLSRLSISDNAYKSQICIQFVIRYDGKEYTMSCKNGCWDNNWDS